MIFSPKNNPTIDKYFRDPLQKIISPFPFATSQRPIVRIGPNTFRYHNKVVIIRYITDQEIKKIHALQPRQTIYLVDDDFSDLLNEDSLPENYRSRIHQFSTQYLPTILSLTDTVVAPNQRILNTYHDKKGLLLSPSYTALCEDFSHFDKPDHIKIVFLGTRSHLRDLEFLSATIKQICQQNKNITFTTFFGHHAPDQLTSIPNITHRHPLSWRKFRQVLFKERFHIGLAPYLDTTFNNARSYNKILDHAAIGAAGLYSKRPMMKETITDGLDGLLIDDDPASWHWTIEELINDIDKTRAIAMAGARLSRNIGDPVNIRKFWSNQLGITTTDK